MPTKKKSVSSKNLNSVANLYKALETAEKMKQKLFSKMQSALDKKKVENLKKKMGV